MFLGHRTYPDQAHTNLHQKLLEDNQDSLWDKNIKLRTTMFHLDPVIMNRTLTRPNKMLHNSRKDIFHNKYRFGSKLDKKLDMDIPGPG